jgi:acyl carrier protein
MKDKIVEVLSLVRPEFDFSESDSFIEDGLLDSFDLISLVTNLEKAFEISIEGTDIVPENFMNLTSIESMLNKYVSR